MNQDRMLASHPWLIFALDAAVIADVAATVRFGVGVDNLAPESVQPGARRATNGLIARVRLCDSKVF
jgi:hypothetical protein